MITFTSAVDANSGRAGSFLPPPVPRVRITGITAPRVFLTRGLAVL